MQNRRIPNYAITASSMWDRNHGPYLGRLHFTARGSYQGAWTAKHNNRYQWFQVDFRRPTKVTSVLTQGRQNANQWVTQYRLAYSQDGLTWAYYKLRDSIKVNEIRKEIVILISWIRLFSLYLRWSSIGKSIIKVLPPHPRLPITPPQGLRQGWA